MKPAIKLLRFKVVSGFHFEHPVLGIIVFETGEVFEQFIDDSSAFTNGLITLTRNNIVFYQDKLKKLPSRRVEIKKKFIIVNSLTEEQKEEFKREWIRHSKTSTSLMIIKSEPTIVFLKGELPRKKKKKFYKTIK